LVIPKALKQKCPTFIKRLDILRRIDSFLKFVNQKRDPSVFCLKNTILWAMQKQFAHLKRHHSLAVAVFEGG
jgi:hypothetical protein